MRIERCLSNYFQKDLCDKRRESGEAVRPLINVTVIQLKSEEFQK